MTERGRALHATADRQVAELIALVSTLDEAALRRPCPGREKLGDGSVGAIVRHTADNYQRIADFVQTSDRLSGAHQPSPRSGHQIPRFLRAIGHGSADNAEPGRDAGQHDNGSSSDKVDLGAVLEQLTDSRNTLGRIAELTDSQLAAIPPDGSFRFCDGQRTVEQVLASLVKHQGHQVQAVRTAFA